MLVLATRSFAVHAHERGIAIWTEHYRADGTLVGDLGRDMAYNFEVQRIVPLPQGYVEVRPDDRFETHCVYDTRNDDKLVLGGDETTQEMCTL